MKVPQHVESALLSLVKEAGERLKLEVVKSSDSFRDFAGYTRAPENYAVSIPEYRVEMCLVWPDDGEFSVWVDMIILAEELIDAAERKEIDEKQKDQEFREFLERIEKAKS